MINWGSVPAGSVLPFPFTTYGKTNGESITLTGLATTDIEVYKGTSMTQRSSDAGYALMDTDGIDIDGVTGFHGFSIDTGDNTDSGFYAAGSYYTVLVSAITVDSQTVSFIAGTFRLVAAENTAGTPAVDAVRLSGDATAADNAEAFFDGTGYAGTNNVIPTVTTLTGHTPQTGDAYARLGAPAGASVSADIAAIKAAVDVIDDYVDGIVADILAGTVEGSITVVQALRLQLAALAGKLSGAATTTVSIRDTGDTKNRIVATVDADGNRSAVTLDGT